MMAGIPSRVPALYFFTFTVDICMNVMYSVLNKIFKYSNI